MFASTVPRVILLNNEEFIIGNLVSHHDKVVSDIEFHL